jgi:hypothetical protein
MHIRRVVSVAVLLAAATSPAAGQTSPTAEDVAAAVREGARSKSPLRFQSGAEAPGAAGMICRSAAREGVCAFTVELQGPLGRVHSAAADAAKAYRSVDAANVPDSLLRPMLVVRATPAPPVLSGRMELRAPTPSHAVLLPIGKRGAPESEAVQPVAVATFPVSWSNLVGGRREGTGLVAEFPTSAVPAGDFYVVIITDGKESRYQIQAKDRHLIR